MQPLLFFCTMRPFVLSSGNIVPHANTKNDQRGCGWLDNSFHQPGFPVRIPFPCADIRKKDAEDVR